MTNKFSINFVERATSSKEGDGYFHSFVALIPEGGITGEFEEQTQKLHFLEDQTFHRFIPIVSQGAGRRRDLGLTIDKYLDGEEAVLLPRWNCLLEQAAQIREKGYIPFNAMRTNCRSGAKTAIESMGFAFRDDFAKSSVGLGPHDFPPFDVFTFDDNKPEHTELEAMRTHN